MAGKIIQDLWVLKVMSQPAVNSRQECVNTHEASKGELIDMSYAGVDSTSFLIIPPLKLHSNWQP